MRRRAAVPAGAAALIHGMAKCIYTRGCTGVRLAFAAIVFVFQLLISSKLFNFCFGKQSLFFFLSSLFRRILILSLLLTSFLWSLRLWSFDSPAECFFRFFLFRPFACTTRVPGTSTTYYRVLAISTPRRVAC